MTSMEEDDLLQHSVRRKRKDGEMGVSLNEICDDPDSSPDHPMIETENNPVNLGFVNGPSFKDVVTNRNGPGLQGASGSDMAPEDDEFHFVSDGEEDDEDDRCPVIRLSSVDKRRLCRPWKNSLIVKLFGRSIGYTYLCRRLKELWKPSAPMDVIALDNNFFLVRFANSGDLDFARSEGPWIIADHYLTIRQWCPEFDPFQDVLERLTVWVRFPCLPIEYYDEELLLRIARKIGEPVKVDSNTSLVTRGHFARVCVELDLTKPLLSKFKLHRRVRRIEYEGLHMVCFECGKYGHMKETCPSIKPMQVNQPYSVNQQGAVVGHELNRETYKMPESLPVNPAATEDFGDWMLVRRDRRRDNRQSIRPGPKRVDRDEVRRVVADGSTGNRFDSLLNLEDEVIPEEQNNGSLGTQEIHMAVHDERPSNRANNVVSRGGGIQRGSRGGRGLFRGGRGGQAVANNANVEIIPSSATTSREVRPNTRIGLSRKAAAEVEHTVVVGNGKERVESWVVSSEDQVGLSVLNHVPPNPPGFRNPSFPHPSSPNIVPGQKTVNGSEDDVTLIVAGTILNELNKATSASLVAPLEHQQRM